jgi:hypothetical protein
MKIKRLVCFCCIYLLIITTYTPLASAADIVADYIRVEITNIHFIGDGRYEIGILLKNKSGTKIMIREIRKKFSAQSDVLGQWIALDTTEKNIVLVENTVLQPFGEQSSVSLLNLSLNIPKLYLNGFGDLNLKFFNEVKFKVKNRSTILVQADESSYWVTPGTDKWILREGM